VLNKVDLLDPAERDARTAAFLEAYRRDVAVPEKTFIISALTGEGTRALTFAIMEYLQAHAAAGEAAQDDPTPQ
jgi:GTP-binding protein